MNVWLRDSIGIPTSQLTIRRKTMEETANKKTIIITGPMARGKTTLAKYLEKEYG
jgi:predicted AAA+ superfamily ATPase